MGTGGKTRTRRWSGLIEFRAIESWVIALAALSVTAERCLAAEPAAPRISLSLTGFHPFLQDGGEEEEFDFTALTVLPSSRRLATSVGR